MKHKLAAAGVVVGLLGGAAAGLALGVPGLAGAQSDAPTTTTTTEDPATKTAPAGDGTGDGIDAKGARQGWLEEALAPLVEAGTLTQAQADAVIEALLDAKPERRHHGPGAIGGLDAAAAALGMTEDELRDALRDGRSLAEVAAEEGVDVQIVIDALVAEATQRLDELVSDGRITQEQADERKAALVERVTAVVDGERPDFGGGPRPGGERRGRGEWGDHDRGRAESPAGNEAETTS